MRPVSARLEAAVVDAQEAAQKAHNLAYSEVGVPRMLQLALGRAQSILMTWEVRIVMANSKAARTRL